MSTRPGRGSGFARWPAIVQTRTADGRTVPLPRTLDRPTLGRSTWSHFRKVRR